MWTKEYHVLAAGQACLDTACDLLGVRCDSGLAPGHVEGLCNQWLRAGGTLLPVNGHGSYRETVATDFAAIRHRERVVLYSLGGMLISGLAAGWLIRLAGMPLHAGDIRRR
jgi:hypothetical protein